MHSCCNFGEAAAYSLAKISYNGGSGSTGVMNDERTSSRSKFTLTLFRKNNLARMYLHIDALTYLGQGGDRRE